MHKLSRGLIYADILTARQALNTYKENSKIKDIKNICAYHLQQAVEKLIKAQIYISGYQYNERDLYTHNIAALIAYIEKNSIPVIIPHFIDINRYDMHFSIRADTLEKYLRVIDEWYESVKQKL